MAGVLDIDSGTEIDVFAINQPISVCDLGHIFFTRGWLENVQKSWIFMISVKVVLELWANRQF